MYSFQCSALQQYTGYKAADLRDCVLVLHDLYLGRRGGSLQVVRAKYKQHKVFYKKCDLSSIWHIIFRISEMKCLIGVLLLWQFKYVANLPCPPELPVPLFLWKHERWVDDTSVWVYFEFMSMIHVARACPNILEISGLKVYWAILVIGRVTLKASGRRGWGINFNLFRTILNVSNLPWNTIPG